MLSIENPKILLFLLLLIPCWIFLLGRFYSLKKKIFSIYKSNENFDLSGIRHSFFAKIFLRTISYVSCVLALAGISFGSENVPVQKNGNAVSFVFDISYSMMAKDSLKDKLGDMSRLEHSKLFAMNLLSRFRGEEVSVVLAKGDGYVAVPLTEDYSSVESLISVLSPELMTSKGSSIGKGIQAAVSSFPKKSARSSFVFVFTDGDETDGFLEKALEDSLKLRVPVFFIGFGSEGGDEIVSGDGKTVTTFLRKDRLSSLCDEMNSNVFYNAKANYIDASSPTSIARLLSVLDESKDEIISYEMRPVKRHVLFLLIAVISFIFSFVFAEIDFKKFRILSAVSVVLLFSSCTEKILVFNGTSDFQKKNYRESISKFLKVSSDPEFSEDALAVNYGLFGLSVNYLSLEEYDKALEKLDFLLESDLPAELRTVAFYNKGIIFQRKGELELAVENFRKAILADSRNTNAKINLELCSQDLMAKKNSSGEQEMKGASLNEEESTLQKEIFSLIRKQESAQWRKLSSDEDKNDIIDY